MQKVTRILWGCVGCLVWITTPSAAQNYAHQATVSSQGGGYGSSATYSHFGTAGETATGNTQAGTTQHQVGFIYVLDGSFAVPWSVSPTSQSHTVLLEASIAPTINGVGLGPSDYIGVFYDSAGTLVPGGVIPWTGSNTALTAYGTEGGEEGFEANEAFTWKVWRGTTNEVYDAIASYKPTGGPVSATDRFVANGISALAGLEGAIFFALSLPQGWSYVSTPVAPAVAALDSALHPIRSDLTLWKSDDGGVYWPQYDIDQLGDWDIREGYLVNMNAPDQLLVKGNRIQPEHTPISLEPGWHLIPYLRTTAQPTGIALASLNELYLVKSLDGRIWWPDYGIATLDSLQPGQGYYAKLANRDTLLYPANVGSLAGRAEETVGEPYVLEHFQAPTASANSMVLGISPDLARQGLQPGDEIAAYSANGVLYGATVYQGAGMAMVVYGDDLATEAVEGFAEAEEIRLVVYRSGAHREETLPALYWSQEGAPRYQPLTALEARAWEEAEAIGPFALQAYPNPSTGPLSVSFTLPEAEDVNLTWISITGQVKEVWRDRRFAAGVHTEVLDPTALPPGTYLLRLQTPTDVHTLSVTLTE